MRLLLLFLLGSLASATPLVPSVPSGFEPGLNLRVFSSVQDFALMAEGAFINETDARDFKQLTVGGYYQGLENLKLGAFIRQAYGLRHDDDWVVNNGDWQWTDTNNRAETFIIFDATPRFMLGEHWLAEFKTRYLFDTYNAEKTLFLRPGLTYFLLQDEKPFWNFFAQYEMDLPLNYGATPIYEQWAYLGALYNVAKNLDVGGFYALKWQTWGSSAAYLAKGGTPYTITAQTSVLCATVVYQFAL